MSQEPLHENVEENYIMKTFHSSQVSIPLEKFQQLKQIVPNNVFFKNVNLDEQESAESLLIPILILPMIPSLIAFQNFCRVCMMQQQ